MVLLYLAKWNALLAVTQQYQKGTKFHKKNKSLLVHIVEWSTTVIIVDIKVSNASLTQNQCFTMCNASLNACWDTATARCHWTEQWRHDNVGHWTSDPLTNRIDYQFSQKKFNQRRLQFLLAYSFSNWLAVSRFSFWKAFVKCPSLSVNGIFDDVTCDVIST